MASAMEKVFDDGYALGFTHCLELIYNSIITGERVTAPVFVEEDLRERIQFVIDNIGNA